ncbi:unnamed protein product [Prunus armeniaca]
MAEVEAAIQEMFQAPHIQVMKTSSRLSKIFLTAMVYELYKTGMGETTFEKILKFVSWNISYQRCWYLCWMHLLI